MSPLWFVKAQAMFLCLLKTYTPIIKLRAPATESFFYLMGSSEDAVQMC